MNGYGFQVILWHFGIMALIYANNFINVLLNNKDSVFYSILAVVASFGLAQYYQIFDVTNYTQPFFQGMYSTNFLFLIPILLAIVTYYFSFDYFKKNLNSNVGIINGIGNYLATLGGLGVLFLFIGLLKNYDKRSLVKYMVITKYTSTGKTDNSNQKQLTKMV